MKLLIIIILVGAFFRFYNLDWDTGLMFHPDERNIANAVTKIHFFKDLNPEFFAYGGLLIYFYRLVADLLVAITGNPLWTIDWGHINLIGRYFSAFFSTFSILLIYLLGRKLLNQRVGLISAGISAICVGFIQWAHFATTESILIFFLLIILTASLKLLDHPTKKLVTLSGLVLGLSIASKTTAVAFIIPPLLSLIIYALKNRRVVQLLTSIALLIVVSLVVFTIFSPYTFLSWDKFIESMRYESGVATGALPVVYTLQFNNTLPYLYQLFNLIWLLGPIFSLAIIGVIILIINSISSKKYQWLILLSFFMVYFGYTGLWHTKFVRYTSLLLPTFILSFAYLVDLIWRQHKLLGNILLLFSFGVTLIWTLAFFSIYQKDQTRITASNWIYQNILPNSKILKEQWDDGLPVNTKIFSSGIYDYEELTMYEPDDHKKVSYLSEKLADGDYLVFNSRRLYGTLINLTDKYPITSKYYRLIFSGSLGYQKVSESSSFPSIFGLDIVDDNSEESFQVYDHPKVMIFKNIGKFTTSEISHKLYQ